MTAAAGQSLTVTVQNAQMFELAFRDAAGGLVPTVGGGALFDEQDAVPDAISQLNSMYFDEIYHGRTGYEQLHRMPVYETTHPPLGKDFIMLGIALFGMTGFGWRFSGTLFGVLLVPLAWCFVRRLTRRPGAAATAGVLLALDFMRFSQSRLATIDIYGTFFILAIIVAIFGSLSPEYFLTTNNITQIFVQSSVTVLIGMGEFFAILVAGIDLSVGAILALSGMVTAKLMLAGVDPFLAAMIGGVLVGGALGAINGCLVNWTGLHPFIITLGTNAIFRGITLVISDANSVYGFSFDFVNFFAASVIGIPVPVIFSLIVALILWFLTTRMRLGRNIYALGGNKNSAFYSGIDVKFHILVVFIISGVCAGLAGVVSTARLGAAEPLAGMGFETYAIASAIIGGTSFFGGKGRIFSVVIGGLIIGTINNGLNILQVQTYYQLVVMGGLIIAAVALDRLISK